MSNQFHLAQCTNSITHSQLAEYIFQMLLYGFLTYKKPGSNLPVGATFGYKEHYFYFTPGKYGVHFTFIHWR
jgi:hypothetical protein